MIHRVHCLLSGVLLAAVMTGGCISSERFTRPRFETLYIGMPQAEVQSVLGKPDEQTPETWTYVHGMPYYRADIHFENQRVSKTEWFDERLPDTQPAGL